MLMSRTRNSINSTGVLKVRKSPSTPEWQVHPNELCGLSTFFMQPKNKHVFRYCTNGYIETSSLFRVIWRTNTYPFSGAVKFVIKRTDTKLPTAASGRLLQRSCSVTHNVNAPIYDSYPSPS